MNPHTLLSVFTNDQINHFYSLPQESRKINQALSYLFTLLGLVLFSGALSAQSDYFYRMEGEIRPLNASRNNSGVAIAPCRVEWNSRGEVDKNNIRDIFLDYDIKEYRVELFAEKVYVTRNGRESLQSAYIQELEVRTPYSWKIRVSKKSNREFTLQLRNVNYGEPIPLSLKFKNNRRTVRVEFLVYPERASLPRSYASTAKIYNDGFVSNRAEFRERSAVSNYDTRSNRKYLIQLATLRNYPKYEDFDLASDFGNVLIKEVDRRYKVCLGTFSSKAHAEEVLVAVKRNGYKGFITTDFRDLRDYELLISYNYDTRRSTADNVPVAYNNSSFSRRYTVQRDDTLYGIAQRYGMTVNELKQINNIRGNMIRRGQVLIVRY